MSSTLRPALVAEDAALAGRDLSPEIVSLWQRYQRFRVPYTASREVLAEQRLQLGRRLLAVHDRVRDDRGFSAWLNLHDIPRATAYRLMQKAAGPGRPESAQPKPDAPVSVPGGTLAPLLAGANFSLDHQGLLTIDFSPRQAAAFRRYLRSSAAAGEDQSTLADRICDALAELARDRQITTSQVVQWIH